MEKYSRCFCSESLILDDDEVYNTVVRRLRFPLEDILTLASSFLDIEVQCTYVPTHASPAPETNSKVSDCFHPTLDPVELSITRPSFS